MKLFVALVSLVVAISAASDQDLWIDFKNTNGKTYKSLREEKLRFNIFQKKLREIETHNAKYEKGEVSYFLKIDQFSDLTNEEFVAMLNDNIAAQPKLDASLFREHIPSNVSVPQTLDWRQRRAVSRVKDQGACGSCWAFGATGAIESQIFIKERRSVLLSEQQLVDCNTVNRGCEGGFMEGAYTYAKEYGLTNESNYPYIGHQVDCKKPFDEVVKISGYAYVERTESALQEAIATVGPIVVRVDTTGWQSYGGGIFDNELCSGMRPNHFVLAVGYGRNSNGQDFWLLKNSWGRSWGQVGYMRLARNKFNQCGVASFPTYPIL